VATAGACGLVIGTFTPIGIVLATLLEYRFAFTPSDLQAPPDGIILLAGTGIGGIDAVSALSQEYPKAQLIFSGWAADRNLIKRLGDLGIDQGRISIEPQSRTTSEDALYTAALLKPKPSERWLLVTAAMDMPRAVGCFRVAGFQVEPYPIEYRTARTHPCTAFAPGSAALNHLDTAAMEWIGLVAYRLMGKTDAVFPRP
jgi:uncharacterized SAM-binding protein YcdF (DUF218 family)